MILLGADAGRAQVQTTDPLPPSDVLRGQRQLLPLDDVMVFRWNQLPGGDFSTPQINFLETRDSSVDRAVSSEPIQTQDVHFGTAAGKMFARQGETIAQAIGNQLFLYVLGNTDPAWSGAMPNPVHAARTQLGALIRPLMAMADFTGDGYAEIVIGSPNGNGGLQVATAVDVTDPSQGVRWGELLSPVNAIAGSALATGDLDGDAVPEVALAFPVGAEGGEPAVEFRVEIYHVDPTQLWLRAEHSVTVDTTTYGQGAIPINKVSIAAGNFDADVSDLGLADEELVVTASGELENDDRFVIQTFQVFSTLQPVATSNWMVSSTAEVFSNDDACCGYVSTIVESGRLDWTGPRDQAVVGISSLLHEVPFVGFQPQTAFWILNFNDDMVFTPVAQQIVPEDRIGDFCLNGMRGLGIGNFDRPLNADGSNFPGTLEIAVLRSFGIGNNVGSDQCTRHPSRYNWHLRTWRVHPGPTDNPRAPWSVEEIDDFLGQANEGRVNQLLSMVTGDFQGGSLWVGSPEIVSLEDLYQPEIVVQAPPMHMDFIQPAGAPSAELLDVSFGLSGFHTTFNSVDMSSTTATHQRTTSNTFAEKESLSRSVSFGVPEVASVSADFKFSSTQAQESVVSKAFTATQIDYSDVTVTTDLDDLVWYTINTTDLYIYPVLCPPDPSKPDGCGTAHSHVVFSVPGKPTSHKAPGAKVEWYQPPHQVGQALSYPWTKDQIETLFPITSISDPPLVEETNLTTAEALDAQFSWSTGSETTTSIGKTNTYSTNTSISVSTSVNGEIDIFEAGAKSSESFSLNTSNSTNTLNKSESSIKGSIGFKTQIPAGLRANSEPLYDYSFSTIVFGQEHGPCPTSPADADAPSDPFCLTDEPDLDEEITTQGALWASYWVDLLGVADSDSWWNSSNTDYFTRHDIALNHPTRWVAGNSTTLANNCLQDQGSSSIVCYVQSPTSLQPGLMSGSDFYKMKGLFVVPAVRGPDGGFLAPQGPQTTIIDADGQVWLQARVYNYSFVATDKNADGSDAIDNRVHVRFYAQEWDINTNSPLAGAPSVLIEEKVLDQCIPGHGVGGPNAPPKVACTNGGDNNWVLATTSEPFDPVAAGIDPGTNGTYVMFWVVAWMEDGSGALVPEVVEHGLTGLPGDLASLTVAGTLSETYGNNLGWFPQVTFVCASGVPCTNLSASDTPPDDDELSDTQAQPEVRIARLDVARKPVAVNTPMEVRALLRAGEVSPRAVHTALFDGDPEAGGQTFDVELVPYLRGDDAYLVRTTYRPDTCGPHELHVVADPGGGAAPATAVAEVEVSADPRTELRALSGLFARQDLPRKERRAVAKDLRHAALAFRRGKVTDGFDALEDVRNHARRSEAIPANIVGAIEARIDEFSACVLAAGFDLAHTPRFRYRRR